MQVAILPEMTSLSLYKPYRLPITQYRHERPVKMVPEVSTKYKRQRATDSANRWKKPMVGRRYGAR